MRLMLLLKISLMICALAAVFYSMRYLRSQEFVAISQSPDSPVSMLLGTDGGKAFNWCPAPLDHLAVHSSNPQVSSAKQLRTAVDWAALCETLMEPVLKGDLDGEYHNVVMAQAKSGKTVYLERNANGVFRVSGTPFRSSSLAKALKRYEL